MSCSDMFYSQWSMVNGEWSMVNGQWSMVNGQWSMVNGQWSMVNGQWSMVNGQWSMVNGQWSMVNGQSFLRAAKLHPFIHHSPLTIHHLARFLLIQKSIYICVTSYVNRYIWNSSIRQAKWRSAAAF